MNQNDLISAKKTIEIEISALREMEAAFDENLSNVLDRLEKTKGKIIVTGIGKSGHVGRKIAATFASTGSPSFFIHPAEASHGDLGMITSDDCVIAISNGGESKELSDIIASCKRNGITLISMTKNPNSSLGVAGDYLLKLPTTSEACPLGMVPTTSSTATLVLGDVLAIALMERKGFSKIDYKQRHPGGKLGAMLKKVSDIMTSGKNIPLVNENTLLKDAIFEMTSKMLGCVGVTDDNGILKGIITDGDLRRCFSVDALSKKVVDVMTKNPKTVAPHIMAAEALKLMNNTGKGITQLFVVDKDNRPVGIVHIHDCLRIGVA